VSAAQRWVAAGVVVLGAVGAGASAGRSAAGPARLAQPAPLPITQVTRVCPSVGGETGSATSMNVASVGALLDPPVAGRAAVTWAPVDAGKQPPAALRHAPLQTVEVDTPGRPAAVTARGPAAATVVADQRRLIADGRRRGLLSVPCLEPATDVWLTGADGRVGFNDVLVLTNPGTTLANITVTAWAAAGQIEPPKLRAFTLRPGRAAFLPVADYTPDKAFVTLHVHANSGRVTAAVLDRRLDGIRAAGIDWIPPTQPPATDLVVPGYAGGDGVRRVVLTNPGRDDATVDLRLSTPTGNFTPAAHPTVVVRGGHSAVVDVTDGLDAGPGAVVLHSDEPVTAAGFTSYPARSSRERPDFQWQPAARAIDGDAVLPDNTSPFDQVVRIYLTAPKGAGRVRVTAADGTTHVVEIRAGRTVAFAPGPVLGPATSGPLVLTPLGDAPVYASRTLFAAGAHGPLLTAEQPTSLPRPVPRPPARPDPRAALP
jgi:hypothetical protein